MKKQAYHICSVSDGVNTGSKSKHWDRDLRLLKKNPINFTVAESNLFNFKLFQFEIEPRKENY